MYNEDLLKSKLAEINKKAVKDGHVPPGGTAICTLAEYEESRKPPIPTGNMLFDYYLRNNKGEGGLWRGTSSIWYGRKGVGKTCAALSAAAATINQGGVVLWIQAEDGGVFEAAKMYGMDTTSNRFMFHSVNGSGERAFDLIEKLCLEKDFPSDLVDLIVLDSLGGFSPKDELLKTKKDGFDNAKADMALAARMFSKFYRIMRAQNLIQNTHLLAISQVRSDIGSYGGGDKHQGGNALDHWPRLILRLTSSGKDFIKEGDRVIGHTIHTSFEKDGLTLRNHHKVMSHDVYYMKGIDNIGSLFNLLVDTPGLVKGGAWINTAGALEERIGSQKWNGEAKFKENLRESKELYEACMEYFYSLGKELVGEEEPGEGTEEPGVQSCSVYAGDSY